LLERSFYLLLFF
jgi:hypothetical protein